MCPGVVLTTFCGSGCAVSQAESQHAQTGRFEDVGHNGAGIRLALVEGI